LQEPVQIFSSFLESRRLRKEFSFKNLFALLVVGYLVSACGAIVTPVAYIIQKNKIEPPMIGQDPFIKDIAARFGFMALLSDLVYVRTLDQTRKPAYAPCDARGPTLPMPLPVVEVGGETGRWIAARNQDGVPFCLDDDSGVFYQTFLFVTPEDRVREAVIVFRGTEGLSLRDWSANLSSVTGIEPRQYSRALQELEKVFSALDQQPYKDTKVYAAGHSLGGGLAQQAGYRFARIKAVYAFNSSPVTNWSWMALKKNKITQDWPVIYRIYHTGEALDPVRSVSTALTTSRFNRYDIGIQLEEKSRIKGHAMTVMTCGFARIIAEADLTDIPHHYPTSYARNQVYLGPLCSKFREMRDPAHKAP
jgi:hypothetical protein